MSAHSFESSGSADHGIFHDQLAVSISLRSARKFPPLPFPLFPVLVTEIGEVATLFEAFVSRPLLSVTARRDDDGHQEARVLKLVL